MIEVPWSTPTRQVQGRVSEKAEAKRLGARLHPNSGAGKIKFDFSDEETIYEHKDATKSHALKADLLMSLFKHAARQGKNAVYVVRFANGIRLVCHVEREGDNG